MKYFLCVFVVLFCCGLILPMASADTLTLALAPDHFYQQTTNNPCVIGNSSCNQPAGFTYYNDSGPGGTYDLYSPIYQADSGGVAAGNLVPLSFLVGVDMNFGTGQGFEILEFFNVWETSLAVGGTGGATNPDSAATLIASFTGPAPIAVDNGNGYADATLSTVNLVQGHRYFFEASVSNDTDGFEQFYILLGEGSNVPEPTTLLLLGMGLLGVGFASRKKK